MRLTPGLDIDALRIVANGVIAEASCQLRNYKQHYQRLLDYIVPDVVHVLFDGRIVKLPERNSLFELEEKGYDWIKRG